MTTAVAAPRAPSEQNLYRYGHRDVVTYDADGKSVWEMVPLTLEQCLHPEEIDYPLADQFHNDTVFRLFGALKAVTADRPDAYVTSDMPHSWGVEGLGHHRPDVAVTFGVFDQTFNPPNFYCAVEGTRPTVIVEVVSPSTRKNDVLDEKKVGHYRMAGIEWYVIVDREEEDDEPRLVGRHLEGGAWVRMEPDAAGQLFLPPPVNAYLRVRAGEVECVDARTGLLVAIGDTTPVRLERDAAERRADAERQAREVAERQVAELLARLAALQPPAPPA